MKFTHPGQLYLQKKKTIETIDDVLAYAEFLRKEAGVDGLIPVDIKEIFAHFGIPEPQTMPLPDLQGLLLDPERGLMLINSTDPAIRQKFTKAHELVELLFSQLPKSNNIIGQPNRIGGFKERTKESICNWTAANLLMPPNFVSEHIRKQGISFDSARIIAAICDVSLTAALVQLSRIGSDCHTVIFWRLKNKPSETKKKPNAGQLFLEGFASQDLEPPKKLRVEWALGGLSSLYIPKDKSIDDSSIIYKACESGNFTSGFEKLTFDERNYFWFRTENLPFRINNEQMIISLVEKLEDDPI